MENKISLPLISISHKVNELNTLVNSLDIRDESIKAIQYKINEIHEEIRYCHDMRINIVDELYRLANSVSLNVKLK